MFRFFKNTLLSVCLVLALHVSAQNDTTLKHLSEMKAEIDRFLSSKALSKGDAAGHVVVDKSAYDSLLSLVIEQQKALLELKQFVSQYNNQSAVQQLATKSLKEKEESLKAEAALKASGKGKVTNSKEQDVDINPADEDPTAMYFALGSSFLTERAKVKVLKCFQANYKNGVMIVVNGYADNYGTDKDNYVISQRRAETVASYIKSELLIPSSQIVVNFFGYSKPRCTSSNSDKCNALNRRVELIFR